MANCSKCRLIKDKSGKFHMFLADELVKDHNFPFPLKSGESLKVYLSFEVGDSKLKVESLEQDFLSR